MEQTVINIIAGVICAVGGWFANALYVQVRELAKEVSELKVEVAGKYVTRDTLAAVMGELKEDVRYIRERLDETPQRRRSDHP